MFIVAYRHILTTSNCKSTVFIVHQHHAMHAEQSAILFYQICPNNVSLALRFNGHIPGEPG